jgi:hypothetical protein
LLRSIEQVSRWLNQNTRAFFQQFLSHKPTDGKNLPGDALWINYFEKLSGEASCVLKTFPSATVYRITWTARQALAKLSIQRLILL